MQAREYSNDKYVNAIADILYASMFMDFIKSIMSVGDLVHEKVEKV